MIIRLIALFTCLPVLIEAQGQPDPSQSPVVLVVPGMERARIERNIAYASSPAGPLVFDAYAPERGANAAPAIVFVSGAEDVRAWKWFESYGRLTAAKGMVGIVPVKRYPRGFAGIQSGYADTDSLLTFLRNNGPRHGVDPDRICVWSFSAGGRLMSVPLSNSHSSVRCVVGFYTISDLSAEFAGVADSLQRAALLEKYSPSHVLRARGQSAPPLFIARAGLDGAVINESIDRFVDAANKANADLTFVNYPDGLHGFDAYNDEDESRRIIEQAFEFIARHTRGARAPDSSRK